MKRILLVLTVLFIASIVKAQTWDEWFHQKETQIKYLVEQIAALKMYGGTVKKGYAIVNGGLNSIGRLKEADLLLHKEHFASLSDVKPGIKGSTVVQRIYSLQAAIRRVHSECQKKFLNEGTFTSAKKHYFKKVLMNVLNQCTAAGEDAILMTSDGLYQMSDDERLKRLQEIYSNLEELYVFARHFQNEMVTTAVNRLKEQKDRKVLKSLY